MSRAAPSLLLLLPLVSLEGAVAPLMMTSVAARLHNSVLFNRSGPSSQPTRLAAQEQQTMVTLQHEHQP